MAVEVKQLKKTLQTAHKGFAYQLLALQIQVQSSKDLKSQSLIQNLSKLIQLYMLGVQVLQSNYDGRYKYFNDKIQGLMKKKHIIQQLHVASTGDRNIPKQALVEAQKQMRQNRKNQHQINIFMNQEHCNVKRVKQIVRKEQIKFQAFKQRLKNSIDVQQNNIKQRLKMRRLRSQCYSSRKFDIGSNPPEQKIKQFMIQNDDIFDKQKNEIGDLKTRSNSGQKKKQMTIKI